MDWLVDLRWTGGGLVGGLRLTGGGLRWTGGGMLLVSFELFRHTELPGCCLKFRKSENRLVSRKSENH